MALWALECVQHGLSVDTGIGTLLCTQYVILNAFLSWSSYLHPSQGGMGSSCKESPLMKKERGINVEGKKFACTKLRVGIAEQSAGGLLTSRLIVKQIIGFIPHKCLWLILAILRTSNWQCRSWTLSFDKGPRYLWCKCTALSFKQSKWFPASREDQNFHKYMQFLCVFAK